MTGFLASVTSIEEAQIALECGADIIDLKNPVQGALGALPVEEIGNIVRFVDGRRLVSATIGDLPMSPEILSLAIAQVAESGVDIVKVGFFGETAHPDCARALAEQTGCIKLVAVLFADQSPNFSLLHTLAVSGFYGAMLDTADKTKGGLCDWMQPVELQAFVGASKAEGLVAGLAGSLRIWNTRELASFKPDYLGFRGALCRGDRRESQLEGGNVRSIAILLRECNNEALKGTVALQN